MSADIRQNPGTPDRKFASGRLRPRERRARPLYFPYLCGIITNMDEQQQILYMQVRILRMASERFGISLKEAAELFRKFDVLSYIRVGWGIFHTEGDEAVFVDIKQFLKSKGAEI